MKVLRRPSSQDCSIPSGPVSRPETGIASARPAGSALTIGNFDGVHRGHAALLREVVNTAQSKGLIPTVVTLDPHPKELFNADFKLNRISTLRDRLAAMKQCGIQQVCVLPFDRKMASLAPEVFVDEILVKQLNAREIWVGDDFRFGSRRAGDFAMLKDLSTSRGFQVRHIDEVKTDGARVSSSTIRTLLIEGRVPEASELLGRPLAYSGHVRHGKKLGRTLGFPTMNLHFKGRASALTGILAVWVHGLGLQPLPAVASMGVRPTVGQSDEILLETFIPDWAGDAYGRLITIEVIAHLRPEQHFADLDQMVVQMKLDTQQALDILKQSPAALAAAG